MSARELSRLSEVQPQSMQWVWDGFLPIGAITDLFGDPGLAKTRITLDIIGRITTGKPMPGSDVGAPCAGAVLLQGEDSIASTVMPDLVELGADLQRIFVYEPTKFKGEPLTLPNDVQLIRNAVKDVQAKLLVIDPVTVFYKCNANSDHSVRQAIQPLLAMAEEEGLAVLNVRHPNKANNSNSLYQASGSLAWLAAARSALKVTNDPAHDDPHRHLLMQIKTNLAKASTIGYRTYLSHGRILVEWLGPTSITVNDFIKAEFDDGSKLREAIEILFLVLQPGPCSAREVYKQASDMGVAHRTLERAKKMLRVSSGRSAGGFGSFGWQWKLPAEHNDLLTSIINKYEALDEQTGHAVVEVPQS